MTGSVKTILAVCGSLQKESSNLELLKRAAGTLQEGVRVEISDELRNLPLFNPDLLQGQEPSAVAAWRAALHRSAGVIIACPEYGHSLPGALKNGIDWVIGSGELYRKAVAITAAVKHPGRGERGLAALKQTLQAVDARIVWEAPTVVDGTEQRVLSEIVRCLSDVENDEPLGADGSVA